MTTMKTVALVCLMFICNLTIAQKHVETISKSLNFSQVSPDNYLVIKNIFGSISVEAYNGKEVKVEVQKQIEAKSSIELEKGKKEISLGVIEKTDRIILYPDTPYGKFNSEKESFRYNENHNDRDYEYQLNFTVKVPMNTNIKLSTVNDGNIYVKGVQCKLIRTNNVNGAITMKDIAGKTLASALNEDINISYATAPLDDSTFKSLNGDININVNSDLNAEVSFKSLNGDFYTNIESVQASTKTTTKKTGGKRGTKYEVNAKDSFQLGKGGSQLSFDLLNGDVTLKRN